MTQICEARQRTWTSFSGDHIQRQAEPQHPSCILLPAAQGKKYFNERPVGSRLSAAASHQSAVIESREALEAAVEDLRQQYSDGEVPHPERWGGYILRPTSFEFWQGRESRLHDRFRYQLIDGSWQIDRLQP